MATTRRRRRRFRSMTNFSNLILVYLLLLTISNSTILFIVQGRHVPLLAQTTLVVVSKARAANSNVREERKMRVSIGSRPPRCDKHKCIACGGHCEAVQVPIWSVRKKQEQKLGYYTRQEVLDYKPMAWMCRCGNFYLNP